MRRKPPPLAGWHCPSLPFRVHATCTFMPVVLCLPEYRSGCEAHDQQGSSVPSTMYCVRPSRSSATGTYSLSTLPSNGVTPVIARLIVGWETPHVSASSAWTRLRRMYVRATVTDLNNPRIGGHGRWPLIVSLWIIAQRSTTCSLEKPVVECMSGGSFL